MDGGSTEVAFHLYRWFSAVTDLTGERSGSVNGGSQGLSLVSFIAGPRFTYSIHNRYAPFGQVLFGAVHGFDSYFPVASGSARPTVLPCSQVVDWIFA
jgi:peptidoglycan-associated lipoprotein